MKRIYLKDHQRPKKTKTFLYKISPELLAKRAGIKPRGKTMSDDDDDDDLFSYHARTSDPETAKASGRKVKATGLMLQVLRYLLRTREPRNGWEMSQALDMPTITVVPRLAPLRRQGAILIEGRRAGPPPYNRAQLAYVITDKGRKILTGEIDLQLNPPLEPWENRKTLRDFLLRALRDGWTDELRAEVAAAFATYVDDDEDE